MDGYPGYVDRSADDSLPFFCSAQYVRKNGIKVSMRRRSKSVLRDIWIRVTRKSTTCAHSCTQQIARSGLSAEQTPAALKGAAFLVVIGALGGRALGSLGEMGSHSGQFGTDKWLTACRFY